MGRIIAVELGQLGQTGRSLTFQRKAAAFVRWYEPDDARVSSPDLWGARGAIPRAYSAIATDQISTSAEQCPLCTQWRPNFRSAASAAAKCQSRPTHRSKQHTKKDRPLRRSIFDQPSV